VLTAADFSGKTESDLEDLFGPEFYCTIVNRSLNLLPDLAITPASAAQADSGTQRIVKQVEAACRTLPAECADFGHFVPADWLLRHPEVLDDDSEDVKTSLDRFEAVFKAINQFLE